MSAIPCYRAAHLRPYLEFLNGAGAPVERGLRQAGLPTMITEGADIYLPQLPSINFLAEMVRREGIDEMPLRALGKLQLSDLNEQFVYRARSAPTLKATLESFSDLVHIEDPYIAFWISYGETTARLCMLNHFPLAPMSQHFEDWNELLVLTAIVQAFAGPAWQPEEMAICSTDKPGRYASEQFPNTRFLTGQQAVWITVPRQLLGLPPCTKAHVDQSNANLNTAAPITADFQANVSGSLKAVLAAYLPDGLPTIDFAAEMAATSVRTLQRRLRESTLSYSDLVGEVRFETAARLLRETDATALEIALDVGYEDPSHFSRAFKRIAGISPREYRRQQHPH